MNSINLGMPRVKESLKLQRSHWAVGGCRPIPYDEIWTTQSSRDFVAPPPVDLDCLVAERNRGAQKLKDLRKHVFSFGTYEGEVRSLFSAGLVLLRVFAETGK